MKQNQWIRLFLASLTGLLMFLPEMALAQTTKLSDLINNSSTGVFSWTNILSTGSYSIAAILGFRSILKFRAVAVGEQVPMSEPIWNMAGAAGLAALPYIATVVVNTVFQTYQDGDSNPYTLAAGNCAAGGMDQCFQAFVADIYTPARTILSVITYVGGATSCGIGVYRLAQMGQAASGRAPKMSGTVGYLAGGAVLISMGQFMDAVTTTIFGEAVTGNFTSLSYAAGFDAGLETQTNNVFMAIFAFMQIVGYIACIRGVFLLVKLSQGEGGGNRSHSHAFTFIIAGVIAINMYGFVQVIQTTLGISLVT